MDAKDETEDATEGETEGEKEGEKEDGGLGASSTATGNELSKEMIFGSTSSAATGKNPTVYDTTMGAARGGNGFRQKRSGFVATHKSFMALNKDNDIAFILEPMLKVRNYALGPNIDTCC